MKAFHELSELSKLYKLYKLSSLLFFSILFAFVEVIAAGNSAGSIDNNGSGIILTGQSSSSSFGYSSASAGDVNGDGYPDVIVGAPGFLSNTGRVYIFFGGISMNSDPDVTITGEEPGFKLGLVVSTAGDVNGDGFDDVIVSANGYTSTGTGRVFIYFGGVSMDDNADVGLTAQATGNNFGFSLACAGDVNNDGYSDVIVGARAYSSFTGRAYIYFGGAPMNNVIDVTMTGEAVGNYFAYSVSSAGDVNNDGYSDVITGASNYSDSTGRSYIYYGGLSMNNVADVVMTGESTGDKFGYSVSCAGDVNDDGYSDIIAGANKAASFNGRAYIFLGSVTMNNTADLIMTGDSVNCNFGGAVSSAKDFNGDGYSDVIVGASASVMSTGTAYIYFGGSLLNNTADVVLTGESSGNNFGYSVSSIDDINDDGFYDVISGATGYSSGTGRAYIYFGAETVSSLSLELGMLIEGFYNSSINSQVIDTIEVLLRSPVSPYFPVDSSRAIVFPDGTSLINFKNAPVGSYYLTLKHRNSIETWSASTISLIQLDTNSYDFTYAVEQAFGNNMKQVDDSPLRFAIYSGDADQDGVVDATDAGLVDNAAFSFATGYVNTDITGDNVVDASDAAIVDNNASNFVTKIVP